MEGDVGQISVKGQGHQIKKWFTVRFNGISQLEFKDASVSTAIKETTWKYDHEEYDEGSTQSIFIFYWQFTM